MRRTTRTAVVLALGWLAVGAGRRVRRLEQCVPDDLPRPVEPVGLLCPRPAAVCCPQVTYVQRCYYQPVTTYKTETYYEPVTTYRTSYYWEPVTRYRYTSYYDPCTGCCHQVCTPCTSYSLRSRCNAVCSYVQRCRMVPCTEMRRSFYLEPVVTYSRPVCQPVPAGGPPAAADNGRPPDVPPAGIGEPSDRGPGPGSANRPSRRRPASRRHESIRLAEVHPGPEPAVPGRPGCQPDQYAAGFRGHVVRDDRITPRANASLRSSSAKRTKWSWRRPTRRDDSPSSCRRASGPCTCRARAASPRSTARSSFVIRTTGA